MFEGQSKLHTTCIPGEGETWPIVSVNAEGELDETIFSGSVDSFAFVDSVEGVPVVVCLVDVRSLPELLGAELVVASAVVVASIVEGVTVSVAADVSGIVALSVVAVSVAADVSGIVALSVVAVSVAVDVSGIVVSVAAVSVVVAVLRIEGTC